MIFWTVTEISKYLVCSRWKIYNMLKKNEIKKIYNWMEFIWYVIVLDFLVYLLKK